MFIKLSYQMILSCSLNFVMLYSNLNSFQGIFPVLRFCYAQLTEYFTTRSLNNQKKLFDFPTSKIIIIQYRIVLSNWASSKKM